MEASLGSVGKTAGPFNPYPGLRPFEPDEDHLFFGRERETDELLRLLRTHRFVSVIGTSGSGKSSLVRSGLIPSLYSGFMVKAGSDWRVTILRPGDDPIGNLAAALDREEVLGGDGELAEAGTMLLETTLRRSALGLADCVRHAHLAPHQNLLVVVDQFEELFRFRETRKSGDSRDEAIAFAKLLLGAAGQDDVPVYVVLTMRSDFIGDCMEYPGLPEAVNRGQYLIPRMTRDELREAITGPAAVGGGAIAPRLVARLLNEVGDDPDQLPVLQHALMRTWERWETVRQDGEPVDLEDYDAVGTMQEALSRHAEEAYGELAGETSRRIAERLFKALTDKRKDDRGVRRPTAVREVAAIAGAAESEVVQVVEVFRKPGRSFLMPPAGAVLGSDSILDLSHESLMRNWTRFVEWVDDEAQSAKAFRRLCRAARRYRDGQAGLWVEPELSLGLKWRADGGANAAWASRYDADYDLALRFLEESKAAHDARVEAAERERRAKLRRARILAGVLGSAALITLAFGLFALRAGRIARAAEQAATREAETARAVSGFLVDLFEVADPEEGRGGTITAREILDEGARNIDAKLTAQPEVRSRLLATMGKVYGSLGLYDQSQAILERAVETARASLGDDAPETLEASDRLAKAYLDRGRLQQSQDLYGKVIEARRRVLGGEHPDTLRSLAGLADAYREQGQDREAERSAREALEAQRRVLGEEHQDTLRTTHVLGLTLIAEGQYREAEPLLVRTLDARRRTLGEEHADTLSSLEDLGTLYTAVGRFDEAEKLYQSNLENRRRIFGDDHPKTFSATERLADLDLKRERFKDASARFEQVLKDRRRVLGEDHPSTLQSIRQVAWAYYREGRFEEAQRLADDAHERSERVLGVEHPTTLQAANTRAAAYSANGRYELAEALYTRNLEVYRKIYGDAHRQTLTARNNLAVVYGNWGQAEKQERTLRENFEIARGALGEDHPSTLFYMRNLAYAYNYQGRRKEAEDLAHTLVERSTRALGPDNPDTFRATDALATILQSQGGLDEAERLFREILEGRRRAFGEDHPDTLASKEALAGLLGQRGRLPEAEAIVSDLLEARRRIYGEEHESTLNTYGWLGWIYRSMGKPERQLPLQGKVVSIRKELAGRADAGAKDKIAYARALVDAPSDLQNPKEAVRSALAANEMSAWKNRNFVATLAEAYSRAGEYSHAVETIQRALALVPEDDPGARNDLEGRLFVFLSASGDTNLKRKMASERLGRLRTMASASDASPRARSDYAGELLTADPPDLNDPAEAIRIALKVNEATGFDNADFLETLALAYHLDGQRDKAIETEKKALSKTPADNPWNYPLIQNRIKVFESTRRKVVDLGQVLEGTWSGKAGPLDMRVDFHRDGNQIVATNRLEVPWIPAGKVWGRIDLGTGALEQQAGDPGWTNLRWIPADYIFTEDGDLLLWQITNWNVLRLTKGKAQPQ